MKLKAGNGDRTRDVQLGNMDVVCLSKTSLFTFIQGVQTIDALEVATSVRDPSLARNGRWKSGVL